MLNAARLAPSANNRQDWKFIVVTDCKKRQQLSVICKNQDFIAQAPAVIVALSLKPDDVMTCGQPRGTVDLSIAMSFLLLEAYARGLGTCWIGAFNVQEVRDLLDIPEDVGVVALTPLGFPAEQPEPVWRKPLSEVTCYERYC